MATYKKWTSTVLVNGQPEPNVRVFVFSPGTTDQIPIYEDEGVTPITQPILTDSQGRYAFFVDVDAYPEIRLYLEKDGVDFSEANEDLDGVPVPGAGAGAGTFLALSDTPSDYTGNAGKVVKVNATEDGLEFGTVSEGAGTFTELTDTPSSYVGRGGDVVVVKNTEDGIETQPWPVTGTVLNVFLSSDAADIGDYYYMYHTETGDTHSEFTSPSLSTGDDQLLWSFVTEAGQPGLNQLALGAYTATLFLKKSGNKDVRVYWKLFKRDTSGNETEILESAVSDHLTTDNSQYLISAYLNEDQVLDPTDRLVLKLYANVSGTGTDVTVTLTMEGDYDSRLTINVLSSAFNLDRLSDVTVSAPADNELLAYDAGSGKWMNRAPAIIGVTSVTTGPITIYVDPINGDDGNDGSAGSPLATLDQALANLPVVLAHDVVINVGKGTLSSTFDPAGKIIPASLTIQARNTSDQDLYDYGTATGGSSTTLQDTSKSWPIDLFKNGYIWIWRGTGEGQYRQIASNTADTITVTSAWDTAPSTDSQYVISGLAKISVASDQAVNVINIPNVYIHGFSLESSNTEDGNPCVMVRGVNTDVLLRYCRVSAQYPIHGEDQSLLGIQDSLILADGGAAISIKWYSSTHFLHLRNLVIQTGTTGSSFGFIGYAGKILFSGSSENSNLIVNFGKGLYLTHDSFARFATVQRFSGCTTNIEADSTSAHT